MSGWLEYDYLIASQPTETEFPRLNEQIMSRIEMSPRAQRLVITDADAVLIVLDDVKGLLPTAQPDLFNFHGNRPDFDDWMSEHHPDIGYGWIDQWVIAFADRAAQLSFDDDLAERVLRAVHLPHTV
jgi:hypothetical protein